MAENRFIRDAECKTISGLSRSTRWRLERDGRFPRRVRIAPNCVAWRLSEILEWQERLSRRSGSGV